MDNPQPSSKTTLNYLSGMNAVHRLNGDGWIKRSV